MVSCSSIRNRHSIACINTIKFINVVGSIIAFHTSKLYSKKLFYVLAAVTVGAFVWGISLTEAEYDEKKKEQELAMQTVEGVRQYIEGTVWTYTRTIEKGDALDVWVKMEFKGGKLYFYKVYPSEGTWGKPYEVDYTVEERRYSNTGNRYIGVYWKGPLTMFQFVPEENSLSFQGRSGFVYGGRLHKGDVNPWD